MKEEPEFARNILTEMPDAEFELYKNYLKELTIPENFMIEAYCMEDDAKAESLLNIPGMVYVKELGYSIYAYYIFMYPHIPVEDVLEFDLTTDSFSLLLNDVKDYFEYEDCYYVKEGAKDDQGRTPRQRLDLIMQNRIKQLATPKTGEAWYFIPVAAVSLVAGIFVICPRRKRIV
jgi:hypothetical protein